MAIDVLLVEDIPPHRFSVFLLTELKRRRR